MTWPLDRQARLRDQRGSSENLGLRVAMHQQLPVIWFVGIAPRGLPIVSNGLALGKIHHAAPDQNFLVIRPDCVVEIQHRLLDELDGPMLLHGLQEHHGARLRQIPRGRAERPAPERLEIRYAEFRST